MSKRKKAFSGSSFNCPNCGEKGRVRNDQQYSKEVKKVWYRCDDDACGHRWICHIVYIGPVDQAISSRATLAAEALNTKRLTELIGSGDDPPLASTG